MKVNISFYKISAILGFHGMLNQVQYHQAFVEKKDDEEKAKDIAEGKGSGFSGKNKNILLHILNVCLDVML